MASILLTGGAGYIGSHTAVELLSVGQNVVIVDDLSNADIAVYAAIEHITNCRPIVYTGDVTDRVLMERIFSEQEIKTVIHFAGYKGVGESVGKPLGYYRNNIDSTLTLLETMARHDCHTFIFSSSATVYGTGESPLAEDCPTGGCTNPYGWTKYMIEQIIRDVSKADSALSAVLLRYFNPVGAHESGLLGEKPNGVPTNLMPYITQAAAGVLEKLEIFGDDYPTPDGTGVRDFVHVVDLAKGHIAAIEYCKSHKGCETFNLGTNRGYSVLELVKTFEQVNGVKVPYAIAPRRTGDLPAVYADAGKARRMLHWNAEKTLEDMCRDAWRFQQTLMEAGKNG